MSNERKWILLNSAKRELQKVLNYTTTLDSYNEELRSMIESIMMIQEEIEKDF
tara:strand:- start:120 stop:278 length:159 start_codon:yes stop_codon:yes gene_type:complete